MPTTIKDAIKRFETAKGVSAADAEKVELYGQQPPIVKLDGTLATLTNCKHLSLSTNNIDKIERLGGLTSLRVLSLGRNQIKKLEGLEMLAGTLQELWISYNLLEKLAGVEKLVNLRVLYAGNNRIRDSAEVEHLAQLPLLEDVLLLGNPVCTELGNDPAEYRMEVVRRVPQLHKLDGHPVLMDEREAAVAASSS